jgi:hypothetical protein
MGYNYQKVYKASCELGVSRWKSGLDLKWYWKMPANKMEYEPNTEEQL